jgi:hypothetical protein
MLNRYGEEASEESGQRADDPPPAAGVANDHLACGNCGLFSVVSRAVASAAGASG